MFLYFFPFLKGCVSVPVPHLYVGSVCVLCGVGEVLNGADDLSLLLLFMDF